MPQLQDVREVKTIKSIIPDGEIQVYSSLLAGDIEKITGANEGENTLLTVSLLIKDWNFTDEKEEKLPITIENIKKLDVKDLKKIQEVINVQDFLGTSEREE